MTQQVVAISDLAVDDVPRVYPVPIQAADTVAITLISSEPGLTAELRDAGGAARLHMAVPDQPGGVPLGGPGYGASGALRGPADGDYELVIRAAPGARYSALVEASSATLLLAQADQERYTTGDRIQISAQLYDGQMPLPADSVSGQARVGDVDLGQLVFKGDGKVFRATIEPPLPAGQLQLLVSASRDRVRREVSLLLPVAQATARIDQVRGEQLADSDGDGRPDVLRITITLQIKRAGGFTMAGQLMAPAGQVVATTEYSSAIQAALGQGPPELAAGPAEVSIDFALAQIVAQGSDGPYRLRLSLTDIAQGGVQVDQRSDAYQTRAYQVDSLP